MNRYKTTFTTWNKIAQLYHDNFMQLDLYNDTYSIFCNAIPAQNPAIFEIGCGPGNITRHLLAHRPDFVIDATDISPNMLALAKQNNPSANFAVLDARDIHTIHKKYNGIICGFCIPYLAIKDVARLVKDCCTLLNPKGVLYLSAIEGNYKQSGYETGSSGDKAYVYYYEQQYLEELLAQNNFSLVQTIRRQYHKKDGTQQTHLILIAELK